MESSGCKSRPVKASMQAGSECCHPPGDWWVRSVHSKEAAVKIQLLNSARCDADAVNEAEGSIRTTAIARSRRNRRSP